MIFCSPEKPCAQCLAALLSGTDAPRDRIGEARDTLRAQQSGAGQTSDSTNPKDLLGVLKLPLRFIPAPALAYFAKVMELGARKYGPFNWRKNKVRRTVYLEAALRHILTAMDGEDLDPESGEPHEAHAMACMGIILDAKATGNLIDDRFTAGVFGQMVQDMQKKVA